MMLVYISAGASRVVLLRTGCLGMTAALLRASQRIAVRQCARVLVLEPVDRKVDNSLLAE